MTETDTYLQPWAVAMPYRPSRVPPTDFLVPRPSFLSGMASAIDLFGVFPSYNKSPSPMIADAWALRADWLITGADLWSGVDGVSRKINEQQQTLFDPQAV